MPIAGSTATREVEVKIVDENGKLDLNQAGHPLARGVDPEAGARAARRPRASPSAILDWRDPDPLTQPAGGAEDPATTQPPGGLTAPRMRPSKASPSSSRSWA